MASIGKRLVAYAAALAVTAGIVLVGAPAQAAVSVKFTYVGGPNGYTIWINNNSAGGAFAGGGRWYQDPDGPYPGDTLVAYDELADGHGVEAHLSTSPQRVASSRGKVVPYHDYVSGNLAEGSKWYMWVCMVKGTYSNCSNSVAVYA